MKKIKLSVIAFLIVQSNSQAIETFTGDKKTACEVLLCLASPSRPKECISPIKKYFKIRSSKPHKTLRKRLNFLKLCPSGSSYQQEQTLESIGIDTKQNEKEFSQYRNVIANLPNDCSSDSLNKRIESRKQCKSCRTENRINPDFSASCLNFYNHPWVQIDRPVYIGDREWSPTRPSYKLWYEKPEEQTARELLKQKKSNDEKKKNQWWK